MDNNQRRNRGQWARNDDAPRKPEPRRDAGAYIGRMPERSTPVETGPGGMIRRDNRPGGFGNQAPRQPEPGQQQQPVEQRQPGQQPETAQPAPETQTDAAATAAVAAEPAASTGPGAEPPKEQ